jgi:hypothetical protein
MSEVLREHAPDGRGTLTRRAGGISASFAVYGRVARGGSCGSNILLGTLDSLANARPSAIIDSGSVLTVRTARAVNRASGRCLSAAMRAARYLRAANRIGRTIATNRLQDGARCIPPPRRPSDRPRPARVWEHNHLCGRPAAWRDSSAFRARWTDERSCVHKASMREMIEAAGATPRCGLATSGGPASSKLE